MSLQCSNTDDGYQVKITQFSTHFNLNQFDNNSELANMN